MGEQGIRMAKSKAIRAAAGALAIALLWPAAATAQVYRCKGASGETVFSQAPCGGDAQEVKVRASRAATAVDGEAPRAVAGPDLSDGPIAERVCLQNREAPIIRSSNQRLADYQRQISGLNSRIAQANNNLAGATWEAGLRSEIAGLQQAAASERASQATQLAGVRTQCAEERRRVEDDRRSAHGG